MAHSFECVPHTARGHFRLNFYAAIYHIVHYLHRIDRSGGKGLKQLLEKFPFMARYVEEMLPHMPDEVSWDEGCAWWEAEIAAWERASAEHLPLVALSRQGNLSFSSRIAFMTVGLVEEDSRFGTLVARLQEPLPHRRPCLELVGQVMRTRPAGDLDAWSICRPLVSSGLVEVVNREAPRSEWELRVPSMLWDAARDEVEVHPIGWCQYHPPEAFPRVNELLFPEEFLQRLEQLPALVTAGKADAIVLRGMQGSERLTILGAVARALGQGVIEVHPFPGKERGRADAAERPWLLLGLLCSMTRSVPVITCDLGPGETAEVPALSGYQGAVGVMMGFEGGLNGRLAEKAVTLTVPLSNAAQRQRYWQTALAGHTQDLTEVSERFLMPGGYIRQAGTMAIAHAALDRREEVRLADIREACRALNRQLLDTLAARLEVEGRWDNLVVSEATADRLRELERRCRHRERLLEHLGPGFGSANNRGVRALFTGASGTGKTLAAKILASELGMDLYRVDLGAVVNKYIGETEKNLHRVLSRAEELDVILLLDEGDALLSSRTEVKSANDRYANLETNYLLQRLENYQGIVVVTTNAAQYIDTAFQRRMDVVVNFVPPQAQERWQIWQLHLPFNHAVPSEYLKEVAVQCEMNGGQIRNAALHATLLAVHGDSGVVNRWHVDEAIQSEYRKAGALCPLDADSRAGEARGGMEAFLGALAT